MNDQPDRADPAGRPVIVGVTGRQPDSVLITAAEFANRLGAELVCAWVDAGRYLVTENLDGSVVSLPFDPDLPELDDEMFDSELADRIESILAQRSVSWSLRALAGEPARALSQLADTMNAQLIVVGARETGLRAEVKELFSGSVAVHLAHRQHRPVLLVPPVPAL